MDSASEWTPVTSGISQGSVLRQVLFMIRINDVNLNELVLKFPDDRNTREAFKKVYSVYQTGQAVNAFYFTS